MADRTPSSAKVVPFSRRPAPTQADLFDSPKPVKLEVHEHIIISGPRNGQRIVHSHPGGDVPHKHEHTGPGCYTIDKDEWLRATGMRGGCRKKFTAEPSGEQFPAIPTETTFQIIVCDPSAPPGFKGEGGGHHAAARMMQAFNLTPIVRPGSPRKDRA